MSITELPDRWRNPPCSGFRKDSPEHGAEMAKKECANKLQAALPRWTRITEDPETWPEDGQMILYTLDRKHFPSSTRFKSTMPDRFVDIDYYWRPLTDLDFPPEES